MSALTDFQQFVTDEQAEQSYPGWATGNPGELSRWVAVRDGILGGGRPALPSMLTAKGRALIDGARQYLDATAPPPPALKVTVTGMGQQGQTLAAQIVTA